MRSSFILVLVGSMKDHLKEGDGHGEEHPDVDHLDVRGDRQALGEAQEAKNAIFCKYMDFISNWSLYSLVTSLLKSNSGPFG